MGLFNTPTRLRDLTETILPGSPPLAATTAKLLLGSAESLSGGSVNGTYIGIRHTGSYSGNWVDFQTGAGGTQFKVRFDGAITIGGDVTLERSAADELTLADALVITGTPPASATTALVRLGAAPAVGSASGNWLHVGAASGFAGNLFSAEVNNLQVFRVTSTGKVVVRGNNTATVFQSENSDASNAAQLELRHSTTLAIIQNVRGPIRLIQTDNQLGISIQAAGTMGGNSPFRIIDSTGTSKWTWDSTFHLNAATGVNLVFVGTHSITFATSGGTMIGTAANQLFAFHGAGPIAQQTVTGSRGGNAALADLLTKLAAKGLLVDGSSA